MKAGTFFVYDPFCVTRGGNVVAKNFKTRENAAAWLAKRLKEDDDGYCGCEVLPAEHAESLGLDRGVQARIQRNTEGFGDW